MLAMTVEIILHLILLCFITTLGFAAACLKNSSFPYYYGAKCHDLTLKVKILSLRITFFQATNAKVKNKDFITLDFSFYIKSGSPQRTLAE